ncbi:MAG: hypothetical protein AUK48_13810 [Oscillatoriales cyanobacterium CG2_30_44_21]|nr:MAG: hypothetical protein AUK48_13810 [Oscillatoriales cyanobacterium CG2_30_44_21]
MFKNSQVLEINNCPKLISLVLVAVVLGTVSASPVAAQSQQSVILDANADVKAKTQIYLSQAQTFFDQGNYDKSMGSVNMAIDANPNNPLAWQMLGNCLKKLGRDREALTAYDQAVKLLSASNTAPAPLPAMPSAGVNDNLPTNDIAQIWVERARALDRLNRFQESVAAYDQALKIRCQEQLSKSPIETLPMVCQPYVMVAPANDPKATTMQKNPQNSTVIPVPNNPQTVVEPPLRNNRNIW